MTAERDDDAKGTGPLDEQPAEGSRSWGDLALRVTLLPRDTNSRGAIFGGVILSQIDLAGGVEVHRRCQGTLVTVAMKEVVFHEPVYVGDLVSFYTRTERVGTTSITVKVLVEAERTQARGRRRVKVTEATVIYVSVDTDGRPIAVQLRGDA